MLQQNYRTQADVPEGLKEYYKEQSGMWVLDGYVTQAKNDEFRENNRSLAKELGTIKSEMLKFKNIDPEKYQDAVAKLQELEDSRLVEAGEFGTLKAKMEQAHVEELKAERDKTAAVQAKRNHERIGNQTAMIVTQHAIPEDGNMKYIQADIREMASVDPETDKIIFLNEKGLKQKNEAGDADLSLEEFLVKSYIPKSKLFRKSTGGGALGGAGVPMASAHQVKFDNVSGMDIPGTMIEDLASGKVQTIE